MNKLQDLKNKLKELQDALDKAEDSNNPHLSNTIRGEIQNTLRDIKREERNQPVSVERGKELFAQLRRDAGLDEIIKYRQFFDF